MIHGSIRRGRAAGRAGLVLVATLLAAAPWSGVRAETVYVSDVLYVPIRTGASSGHRIIKVFRSGTELELKERSDGWVRVTADDGTEGWVEEQYVLDQPIARDRLQSANREVERLTRNVSELRQQLQGVQSERREAEQSNTGLSSEVSRLEQELAEIKSVSASAIETAEANRRLTELNARLRDELDTLLAERDRLEANAEQRWLMLGGALVLIGMVLGAVIKSRPRRSAWT